MNEDNELLLFIHENVEMGVITTEKLLSELNDKQNNIKKIINEMLDCFLEFKTSLKEYKKDLKGISPIATMGAKMAIKKDVNNDNSDSKIASMLIEGFTMGLVQIESNIKKYKDEADKDLMDLAKEYKRMLEKYKKELEVYL